MAKKQQSSARKWLSRLITITCVGVFVYAAYGLGEIGLDYYKNRKMLGDLQETFYDSAQASDEKGEGSIRSGFDKLKEENEDVVGWLTVDETQIDYPIVQAEDNEQYLTCNFYMEESRAGSIFLDYRNDIEHLDDERNIVVYGHRMKDGSMFQHLTKFLNEDFFAKNPKFTFDTLYDSYEAEVFAVYHTLTEFDYIQTDFSNDLEFANYLSDVQEKTKFNRDVDLSVEDQIITLSTCDYELDQDEGRLVLQAKLVKK